MKKRLIISLIVFIAAAAVLTTLCILVRKNNLDPLGVDVWARDLAYNTRGEKGGLNYWFWRIFTEAGDLYVLAVLCVVMLIYTKLDYRFMIFLGSKPVLSPRKSPIPIVATIPPSRSDASWALKSFNNSSSEKCTAFDASSAWV